MFISLLYKKYQNEQNMVPALRTARSTEKATAHFYPQAQGKCGCQFKQGTNVQHGIDLIYKRGKRRWCKSRSEVISVMSRQGFVQVSFPPLLLAGLGLHRSTTLVQGFRI